MPGHKPKQFNGIREKAKSHFESHKSSLAARLHRVTNSWLVLESSSCGLYIRTDGVRALTPLEEKFFWGTQFMAPAFPDRCTFSLDRSVTVRSFAERLVVGPNAAALGVKVLDHVCHQLKRHGLFVEAREQISQRGIACD